MKYNPPSTVHSPWSITIPLLLAAVPIFMPFLFSSVSAAAAKAVDSGEMDEQASLHLTDKEKAWLAGHKTIRVAFDGYFPPYSFLDDTGEYKGLAVDMLRVLAERMGVIIVPFQKPVWKDLYEAAKHRKVDVVATMGKRPEREKWFAFTKPYIFKSLVIMTRRETTGIAGPADLTGRRVAVVKSYQYVKDLITKYPAVQPVYVDTMLDGLNTVAVGKADAAITFIGAGHYLKSKYELANLKFAAVYDRDRFVESIGVRGDWPELAAIFDKALASITEVEKKKISRRWLGPEVTPWIDYRTFLSYLALILGAVVLLAAGFLTWNRLLRRQVDQKTTELRQELAERKKAEAQLVKYREGLEERVQERTGELRDAQEALLNLLEDLTESKEALEKANEKLQELDRLKSMFIASMSHELRTPLNSIIGFTGIILQGMSGEINAEIKDQLQRVYRSGKHLLALINDVIDISKIEANRIDIYAEEFDPNDVIKEAISTLGTDIKDKGLELETVLAENLIVQTDRKRLLQCVLNIVGNAVKYTEKGKIKIVACEIKDKFEIVVTDTGIGIKEEDLPTLFDPFIRTDSPLKTKVLGTGLGLYLTKKIVTEMLGGEVFVESRWGMGSTFGMRVPKDFNKNGGDMS